MVTTKSHSKYVCVIGGRASGLVAARELRKEGHKVVVIEQNHDIGGQWLYNPKVIEKDPLGKSTKFLNNVHSSVYESLRLRSPREVMGFTDFPFVEKKGRDFRRFPGHKEVWYYLNDFCECFGLRSLIRFNTKVEYVGMVELGTVNTELRWIVKSKEGGGGDGDGKAVEEVFDAVVVASGHYTHPRLPTIKGIALSNALKGWTRVKKDSYIVMSTGFPNPLPKRQIVVAVGCALSGEDISMELARVAKQVYISAKPNNVTEGFTKVVAKRDNLHLCPPIDFIEEDGQVSFLDGSWVIADSIIYCTGYSYAFPFLDTKGKVTVDDNRVGPLYEHTFPPSLAPSLFSVGIPQKLLGFPFFESQGKWVAQLLSGKKQLPLLEQMMQSIKEFYQSKEDAGVPKHYTHDLRSFDYCDRYGDNVEFPHLEVWRRELLLSSLRNSDVDLENFRDEYDDDFELLQVAHQSPHFTQLRLETSSEYESPKVPV